MNRIAGRGEELLAQARPPGGGGGPFARLFTHLAAGGIHRVIDRIDAGLRTGSIEATLPDGSRRLVGGRAPGFDAVITLHHWRALVRLATSGSVGWYQAWEAGEWSSPDPVQIFALFMANADALGDTARAKGPWRRAVSAFHRANGNSQARARQNIHLHYDLGNDFYSAWLDPTMSYSSARFDGDEDRDLESAQRAKWAHLSQRIGTPPGRVLEIGCGWGALSGHLQARGWDVTAISISAEQLDWARAYEDAAIDFRFQDYREVDERVDAIVSVEMVEAVGREYWGDWLDCIARCLKPGGRAAIQYITIRDSLFDAYAASADFIQTYIFPGGLLIRESEMRELARARGLSWEDTEHFPLDYARTLAIWRARFDAAVREGRLPDGFDKRFRQLWRYYLMYCEGGFRGGGISVAQATLVRQPG
jgi:cyclopropane-fatty-acyl-phospholipid synthase